MRVSRYLAQTGICSRRGADVLISQGVVTVNGRPVGLGAVIEPHKDVVRVYGKVVEGGSSKVYVLLNKPPGYLSSCADPFGRKTVIDLVKDIDCRVFPVGRLDYDSDGLLLMTNDGDLAYILTHPKFKVVKEYLVSVSGAKDPKKIADIKKGVVLDGKKIDVDYVQLVSNPSTNLSQIRIGLHEGEKHVVKRICQAVGYRVLKLTRTKIGRLSLGRLNSGKWRHLTANEVKSLYAHGSAVSSARPKNNPVNPKSNKTHRNHFYKTR